MSKPDQHFLHETWKCTFINSIFLSNAYSIPFMRVTEQQVFAVRLFGLLGTLRTTNSKIFKNWRTAITVLTARTLRTPNRSNSSIWANSPNSEHLISSEQSVNQKKWNFRLGQTVWTPTVRTWVNHAVYLRIIFDIQKVRFYLARDSNIPKVVFQWQM